MTVRRLRELLNTCSQEKEVEIPDVEYVEAELMTMVPSEVEELLDKVVIR